MPDFAQYGPITTIHALGTVDLGQLETKLSKAVRESPIGLVLPITASDMRAEPFANIARTWLKRTSSTPS